MSPPLSNTRIPEVSVAVEPFMKLRPDAWIARSFFKDVNYFAETVKTLLAGNEPAVDSSKRDVHNANTLARWRRCGRQPGIFSRAIPASGCAAFPVVAEAGLLEHSEHLVVV